MILPQGNILASEAVIAVPFGADGLTPISATNPPISPATTAVTSQALLEQLGHIHLTLNAILILLTPTYQPGGDPNQFLAAARSLLNNYNLN